MKNLLKAFIIGALLAATVSQPVPARADASSTALYVGAAAIVGAILLDSNNHPYYVRDNRRYYVTQDEAQYYRNHHHVVQRQAWVPEQEYPIQRDPGYYNHH